MLSSARFIFGRPEQTRARRDLVRASCDPTFLCSIDDILVRSTALDQNETDAVEVAVDMIPDADVLSQAAVSCSIPAIICPDPVPTVEVAIAERSSWHL
jgi:hypothetical protein